MIRAAVLLCTLMLTCVPPSLAETPSPETSNQLAEVEKTIRSQLPDFPINWVKPSVIDGLYEVKSGSNLFYVDATGKHLINGNIFDTSTKQNLTKIRLEEINRIDWSKLPLEYAIVSGDDDGIPIAIFTDPDCPFCRKLEEIMEKAKGLKVYTFLYPLESLHPKAREKSEAIWCSKDRHKALQAVMLKDKPLDKANCKTPVANIIALGNRLGINGTPTMIASDGRRRNGATTAKKLKAWAASTK